MSLFLGIYFIAYYGAREEARMAETRQHCAAVAAVSRCTTNSGYIDIEEHSIHHAVSKYISPDWTLGQHFFIPDMRFLHYSKENCARGDRARVLFPNSVFLLARKIEERGEATRSARTAVYLVRTYHIVRTLVSLFRLYES